MKRIRGFRIMSDFEALKWADSERTAGWYQGREAALEDIRHELSKLYADACGDTEHEQYWAAIYDSGPIEPARRNLSSLDSDDLLEALDVVISHLAKVDPLIAAINAPIPDPRAHPATINVTNVTSGPCRQIG
jgi:hypothetical protein